MGGGGGNSYGKGQHVLQRFFETTKKRRVLKLEGSHNGHV
jgi:hypothetical protein